MLGLAVGGVYAAILFACNKQWQEVYRKTTYFLFGWYVGVAVLTLVVWLSAVAFGTAALIVALGPLASVVTGSAYATAVVVTVTLLSAFQVLGAYFVSTSLNQNGDNYSWNWPRLTVGLLFLAIGLLRLAS